MDYLEYKGYKGSVEYSKEDNCLFGKVQGMSKDLIVYEGQTLEELRKDFEAGVDSYLDGCKADGVEPAKPYSGRLNLRMSSELQFRPRRKKLRICPSRSAKLSRPITDIS